MRRIDCDATVTLGPDELEVRLIGSCYRAVDKRIECSIEQVLYDSRDILSQLPKSALPALRTRMACSYIASGIRGHESVTDGWQPDGTA